MSEEFKEYESVHFRSAQDLPKVHISKKTMSSQDRVLQHTVEQSIDESCVPSERVQQLTALTANVDDVSLKLYDVFLSSSSF